MDKHFKFPLPSPNFNKNAKDACKPKSHYLTPSGMSLLPREKQPPPMYGKHGATLPGRYLKQQVAIEQHPVIPATTNAHEKQYCEPCEIELNSFEDLKWHRAQHEKCPVAGCLYKGHPSVMDKHINALHASGLFDKFKKFSTPEEIAAWREERRKRYPTLANVLLKQKAKEQRQKRGERLETNKHRFGKMNDRKRAQPIAQVDKDNIISEKRRRGENKTNVKNKKIRKNKHKNSKNYEVKLKIQDEEKRKDEKLKEENDSCGIKMFRGTSLLQNYKHFNKKKKAIANNVLFGLVGMYGSDDDDQESDENNGVIEDNLKSIEIVKATDIRSNIGSISIETISEQPESNEIAKIETIEHRSNNSSPLNITPTVNIDNSIIDKEIQNCTSKAKENLSDEAPEEIPIQRSIPDYPIKSENNLKIASFDEADLKPSKQQMPMSKKRLIRRKSGLDYRKTRLRKQNTMLEKLLESDIRHERNVLLQCVRYVCQNNFFDIGQNKNPQK